MRWSAILLMLGALAGCQSQPSSKASKMIGNGETLAPQVTEDEEAIPQIPEDEADNIDQALDEGLLPEAGEDEIPGVGPSMPGGYEP